MILFALVESFCWILLGTCVTEAYTAIFTLFIIQLSVAFCNVIGEALLVERNGDWTLPTGHMDTLRDINLKDTLAREMKEELKGLKSLIIVEALDTFVRHSELIKNGGRSLKPKSIAIYSCNVHDNEIEYFNEGGERRNKIWIRPSQALKLPNLDELAKFAITSFLEKYPAAKKEGGKNAKSVMR